MFVFVVLFFIHQPGLLVLSEVHINAGIKLIKSSLNVVFLSFTLHFLDSVLISLLFLSLLLDQVRKALSKFTFDFCSVHLVDGTLHAFILFEEASVVFVVVSEDYVLF